MVEANHYSSTVSIDVANNQRIRNEENDYKQCYKNRIKYNLILHRQGSLINIFRSGYQ